MHAHASFCYTNKHDIDVAISWRNLNIVEKTKIYHVSLII